MGTVTYGPTLVSGMQGVCSRSVLTWAPPRAIIGKRKRGVRNRKVGKYSVPKLLSRLDIIWRAMPESAKFALRKRAAANGYTNYIWFRRHVLNHTRRTGWKGPLALDLDTGYYIPVEDAGYLGGDVIELRWDDPGSSPASMNLTNVNGEDCTMTQNAIHCEDEPPPPPAVEYTWVHAFQADMMPWWKGTWTLISGEGHLWMEACVFGGCVWSEANLLGGMHLDIIYAPTMGPVDWQWIFTPFIGAPLWQSGTDTL